MQLLIPFRLVYFLSLSRSPQLPVLAGPNIATTIAIHISWRGSLLEANLSRRVHEFALEKVSSTEIAFQSTSIIRTNHCFNQNHKPITQMVSSISVTWARGGVPHKQERVRRGNTAARTVRFRHPQLDRRVNVNVSLSGCMCLSVFKRMCV